jgi:glycosyltransferase involved in cell wall biosynthesis
MHKTILIVTDNLPTQINGVVTTFQNIQTHADRDGYDIVYLDPGQFYHIDCPGYPEVKLSLPWKIGKKIKALSPDYIHIATEGPVGLGARIWCDMNGYAYNTSYHTKFPEFLKKIYSIPESFTYRYVRWFHKHSGRVLTTTQSMVDQLYDHKFKTNIVAWTRGVDREYLQPSRVWNHDHYIGLKPLVLYVGRVSKEKNLDALCKLQHKYKIHIVGDGPDRIRLEREYPGVEFLGYKTGQALADCYAWADVFAFPSLVDTFGIVIIESLSLGTPVAAFPVQGPIDILEEGVTGYMCDDLSTSIDRCLLLNRDKVKQSSERWTWENCWEVFKENLTKLENK